MASSVWRRPHGGRYLLCLFSALLLPGCIFFHRHRESDLPGLNPGTQPDKVLYEKAVNEISHGRYDVGRLTLQTLLNTYPDSEYLAKAKLAIADSYYQEGGVSGLTQAEAEYKDFITFFPTAPEAPEAQFRVGMAHFRLMAKPDRDRAEALAAEAEFKEFLAKYPDSPVMPRVKARLREVQELLAQSDFKVAKFYYQRGVYPAARGRLQEIAEQYPNFSQADEALWYLGQTLEHMRQSKEAATYYARIVSLYPLSPRVDEAKGRLLALHQPVPRPTKAVLARAEADARNRHRAGLFAHLQGMISSGPDLSATRHGPVELKPARPVQVEEAKAGATAPVGNTISAEPVPESALKSGKPLDPASPGTGNSTPVGAAKTNAGRPSDTGTAAPKAPPPQAQQNSQNPAQDASSADVLPTGKKGRFHVLKKLIPF